MAKGYATRRYQLTINNPQEHGYDHNVIKAALEKGAKLLYWCMADEVGQEETYHIHLFLVYENPVMFTTLKNKFPTAHIEVPQWGKNSENYAYIRKEGAKYNKDANGHYKYTDSKGKVHEGINYSDTFEESADAQSSIVILDDGSAAKLPAIPGRFIIRNGSGSDEIIQAYYYHQ